MDLKEIGFNYDLPSENFSRFDYLFEIPVPDKLDKDEFSEQIKNNFGILEKLVDAQFSERNKIKMKKGDTSQNFLAFGYDYKSPCEAIFFRASLECKIYSPFGRMRSVTLSINHADTHEFLLKLYDAILSIPQLVLNDKSRYSAGKIACLRAESNFIENPLKLLIS